MGYIYSVVAAVAFAMLGITYKLSDRRKCDQAQVNFFLLASAAVIVLISAFAAGIRTLPMSAVGLGAIDGILIFFGIYLFRKAVALGRISTSWTIINLGLVVPVLASVFIWHEIPHARHYAGFALTVVAITLLGIDAGRSGE